MSDLRVTPTQLERSRSQLSVRSYFDPQLFQRELDTLFRRGPRYVGHELSVPEVGDYHALVRKARAGPWFARRTASS
jgi:choline monooxygenase